MLRSIRDRFASASVPASSAYRLTRCTALEKPITVSSTGRTFDRMPNGIPTAASRPTAHSRPRPTAASGRITPTGRRKARHNASTNSPPERGNSQTVSASSPSTIAIRSAGIPPTRVSNPGGGGVSSSTRRTAASAARARSTCRADGSSTAKIAAVRPSGEVNASPAPDSSSVSRIHSASSGVSGSGT